MMFDPEGDARCQLILGARKPTPGSFGRSHRNSKKTAANPQTRGNLGRGLAKIKSQTRVP
jgi:hypothetical protein